MLISGLWLLCDDGIIRPVIHGEVLAADGSWVRAPFLADTGADRTAFSSDVLKALELQTAVPAEHLSGVGGSAESVLVETQLQFRQEDGTDVVFRGRFAAFTQPGAVDMSVLGRDITNLFAAIVDRPRDLVVLLGQRHSYTITYQ